MSLRIQYPPEGQLCTIGWHITTTTTGQVPNSGSMIWGYNEAPGFSVGTRNLTDPLWTWLPGLVINTTEQKALFLFNMGFVDNTTIVEQLDGTPPSHILFNQEADRQRHGGMLSGIYTCIHGDDSRRHVVVNERETAHLNFAGSISHSTPSGPHPTLTYGSGTAVRWGQTFHTFTDGVGHRYGLWDSVLKRFTGTSGRVDPTTPAKAYLYDVLKQISDNLDVNYSEISGDVHYRRQYWLKAITVTRNAFDIEVFYRWRARCWTKDQYPNGKFFEVDIEKNLRIGLESTGATNDQTLSGSKPIPYGIRISQFGCRVVRFAYGNGLLPGQDEVAEWIKGLSFSPRTTFRSASYRTEGQFVCSSFGTGFGYSLLASKIWWDGYKLRDFYNSHQRDLMPAVFYSTAGALNNFTDVITANHIETLNGYGEIIEMVKSLGSLIKFFRALRHMDIQQAMDSGKTFGKSLKTTKGLAKLMDTTSGAYLAYSFGVAPMLSDGKEFVEKYDDVVSRLEGEGKWGRKILYGDFRYDDLPNSNFGPISMRVHTKTCLSMEDTTLLTLIFSASALGVLPGLGALWECVPWSFAIDWFTNMGQRLEDVDNQALLFLLEHHYSVHSIKLISHWSDEYLSDYEMQKIEDPRTTYYHRWLSYILPTLRPSQYDFRAPSGELPRTVIGCLTWQLL